MKIVAIAHLEEKDLQARRIAWKQSKWLFHHLNHKIKRDPH